MATYASLVFTPRAPGKIVLLADFEAQITAAAVDWASTGNYIVITPYIKPSGGSYDYGPIQRISSVRQKFAVQHVKNVAANVEIDCGIEMSGGGLVSGVAYFINIRAHLVKETSF